MLDNIQLLIVDDEVRFLQTLKERLQLRGFDVTAVTNGTLAIEGRGTLASTWLCWISRCPGWTARRFFGSSRTSTR